jgi:putative DNA primase/helicase
VTAVDGLLAALDARGAAARRSGSGWIARCPAHEDAKASLSIGEGADGRALLKCFAGCSVEDVTRALGLDLTDLFPDTTHARAGSRPGHVTVDALAAAKCLPAAFLRGLGLRDGRQGVEIPYRDATGKTIATKRRTALAAKEGSFWPRGVPLMAYGLDRLDAARAGGWVFFVEGESDCWTLWNHGLPALGIPGASAARVLAAEHVEGFGRVYMVQEPDNGGEAFMRGVAARLSALGWTGKLRAVSIPGAKDPGELWCKVRDAGKFTALLREAVRKGRPPVGNSDGMQEIASVEDSGNVTVSTPAPPWPDPEPLPDDLPQIPSFDDRLLPEALRPWLSDVAERTQCPPEYAAVGALVALSAVVGRGCAIRPKRYDDWTVVPNLWGAVVGPPSSMKSPALTEALRPLKRLAAEAADAHRKALEGRPAALAEARARRAMIEAAMKKAAKRGEDMEDLRAQYEAAADPPEPPERRYMVNDATIEKLGELLNQNPRGLLHFRDELTGWLATLDRHGHENDRAFFLEAWNGTGPYTYDRIGRGTLRIEAPCVSMLGGIQPGPLAQYLRAALRGGAGDDGLMQRFQLAVYPDPPRVWRNVDRWPDGEARDRALAVYRRLDALTPEALGATLEDGLPFLRFRPEAQELFDEWREGLMVRLRSGEEHPAIEAHLAKFDPLVKTLRPEEAGVRAVRGA